jgi:DNA-binding response OmpR family regulator
MSDAPAVFNLNILVLQVEESLSQRISTDLKEAGYYPFVVPKIDQGIKEYKKINPAMIFVERQLLGETGIKFCRQLRQNREPIYLIIIVENESVEERLACLEIGADDYLVKPYHTEGFLKLVSFYLQPEKSNQEQSRFADLILDLNTRRLYINQKGIDLTMKEFELLRYLMAHPREVLTREQILENVWGYDFQGESNVIEVYIRYLRLKLEAEGQKRLIHTVRGVGYVLRES